MSWIYWAGGISIIILALLGLSAPLILRSKKDTNRTETINNMRQINLALIDFDADYGKFPDATTIADVQTRTHTTLALGTATSNDYFRQLIAAGTMSEKIFWAKIPATPHKPNDRLGPDALKKGECSFAYVAGLSTSSDPGTPVVMTPMIPGTFRFDSNVFADKAIIMRVDGSVKMETIRSDTHEVSVGGGMTLFDPRLPYWHGKVADLKWPE
ncbi:hypothetical protein OKA05_23895 [Luteolibacter arcticus]|uniref:DUF1559 domain-containing protein n=1 Tax=Luteolibacter arcticus TaxID=1581411 RepID=A0ABT3GQ38_9BACT|nr:hypothetical protein [Luteolibacter arcticus]MCW1925622.1 hypothetical protein [Luteolibacter arcticus]